MHAAFLHSPQIHIIYVVSFNSSERIIAIQSVSTRFHPLQSLV